VGKGDRSDVELPQMPEVSGGDVWLGRVISGGQAYGIHNDALSIYVLDVFAYGLDIFGEWERAPSVMELDVREAHASRESGQLSLNVLRISFIIEKQGDDRGIWWFEPEGVIMPGEAEGDTEDDGQLRFTRPWLSEDYGRLKERCDRMQEVLQRLCVILG